MSRKKPRPPTTQAGTSGAQLEKLRAEVPVRVKWAEGITGVIQTLLRTACICVVSYFFYKTAQVCAGKDTHAVFSAVLNLGISRGFLGGTAVLASGAYVHKNRTSKKTVKDMGDTIAELERRLDEKRSSSELTTTPSVRNTRKPKELKS